MLRLGARNTLARCIVFVIYCLYSLLQMTMSCKPSFREAGPRSYREVWCFCVFTVQVILQYLLAVLFNFRTFVSMSHVCQHWVQLWVSWITVCMSTLLSATQPSHPSWIDTGWDKKPDHMVHWSLVSHCKLKCPRAAKSGLAPTYEPHELWRTSTFLIIMQWRKLKISTFIFRLCTFCETWW